ncbi:RloB domain-containing protein [Acetobacterium paludosum]|nr:RloB domain-containing protein [Acetobacterium paludosum]
MARTVLSTKRLSQTKEMNIGQTIIFCEGPTEKIYFDYFSEIIEKNKFTDIQVEVETVGGNARTVLNFANAFLANEKNNRKFTNYAKYLVFDCDASAASFKMVT